MHVSICNLFIRVLNRSSTINESINGGKIAFLYFGSDRQTLFRLPSQCQRLIQINSDWKTLMLGEKGCLIE